MKNLSVIIYCSVTLLLFILIFLPLSPSLGATVPSFSLKGIDGKNYQVSSLKDNKLAVLFFFDPDSRPSQEGMIWLKKLKDKYINLDFAIWAISSSDQKKVADFCKKTGITFPVLIDQFGSVSKKVQADIVLPTTLIIGPELRILDKIQGGGRGMEMMVVAIAERELQRKNFRLAKKLVDEVTDKNPGNVKAKIIKGYAELKSGKPNKAEKIFSSVSKKPGTGKVLGTEGLAAVYAYKGNAKKALILSDKVIKMDPKRAYPHVIKGNILYALGRKKKARRELETAVKSPKAEAFQEAIKFNQLGRLYASIGQYEQARHLYDQAVTIDPYYVEGMANKGITFEKQGKLDKALATYKKALKIDAQDSISALLARKAQEMLDLQKDVERSRRIDRLVKELAKRFREQKRLPPPEDQWTSRPMIITFLGFQERGSLSERDGLPIFFTGKLSDYLNSSGRVKVVERVILDKLLQELNLGSSDLADKETALRLGRILAAKLIATGSFYHYPGLALLSMRLIDTETSRITMVENRKIGSMAHIDKDILDLNRKILHKLTEDYPLKAYIISKENDNKVMINIGSRQGVVLGTVFEVLSEKKPIVYKGRILKREPLRKGIIKVIKVEPDLSYATILNENQPIGKDDKIREIQLNSTKQL